MNHYICIPCSGDAMDPANHLMHARLDVITKHYQEHARLYHNGQFNYTYVLYGRRQPGMKTSLSEARSAEKYLREKWNVTTPVRVVDDATIKSTAAACKHMAELLRDETAHIVLVNNRPYMARTQWLLKYHFDNLYGVGAWEDAGRYAVTAYPVPLNFKAYVAQKGWPRAALWYLWNVRVREVLAWVKAWRDPDDTRLNQKRNAPFKA